MDSIAVTVFLVKCAAGLLVCETVPSDHMRYAAMETCRAEVSRLVAEKRAGEDSSVWMGKCLYRLDSADPRRARRDLVFAGGSRVVRTAEAGR